MSKDCWEGRGHIGPRERENFMAMFVELLRSLNCVHLGAGAEAQRWKRSCKQKRYAREKAPRWTFAFLLRREVHSEAFFYCLYRALLQSLDNRKTHKSRQSGRATRRLGWWWHGTMLHLQLKHSSGWAQADQERQGRTEEAVRLCAKELFHFTSQYETGSEPLAQYHTGWRAQGKNTWGAEVGSVTISFRNQRAVLGLSFTAAPQGIMPGDPWISLHFLTQSLVPALLLTLQPSSAPWPLASHGCCRQGCPELPALPPVLLFLLAATEAGKEKGKGHCKNSLLGG